MTDQSERAHSAPSNDGGGAPSAAEPTLSEDLLLLLFQPEGTIAGEGTLFYTLAGGVLADLAMGDHVRAEKGRLGFTTVEAVADKPPADRLLLASWQYVADKPRGVQTVLAATGPSLREPLLDRLVARGDLRRGTRKFLGLFRTSSITEGDTGRRAELLREVRAVLVDGKEPAPRIAALAALLYGSGTLPQFDRDIPWTSEVVARAEELKAGNWGAKSAALAVIRTTTAVVLGIAASTTPRG